VILGNKQVEGLNYNETFARVDEMLIVCTFVVVDVTKN